MATVWTVPLDITSRWLASAEVQNFLASNDLPDASADPLVRIAQFGDVTRSLERNIGRTFSSVQAASTALFDGIEGGVPVALKLASLRLILREVYQTRPAPQPLPPRVAEELGRYVYLLLDPRTRSVFHVGVGSGDRVYGYVWEALAENERRQSLTDPEPADEDVRAATISRIREIYDSGLEVDHYIAAHRLADDVSVDTALATLVGGLELAEPGVLTNRIGDAQVQAVDSLVLRYAAEPAPELPTPCLLLDVPAAGRRGITDEQIYALARGPWDAGTAVRGSAGIPVIVFADNVVRAAYRARSWSMTGSGEGHRWQYDAEPDAELADRFVGRRITPDRVGLKKWPAHGWIPHLTHARPGR